MTEEEFKKKMRGVHILATIGLVLTLTIIGAPIGIPMIVMAAARGHDVQGQYHGGGPFNYLIRPPVNKQ